MWWCCCDCYHPRCLHQNSLTKSSTSRKRVRAGEEGCSWTTPRWTGTPRTQTWCCGRGSRRSPPSRGLFLWSLGRSRGSRSPWRFWLWRPRCLRCTQWCPRCSWARARSFQSPQRQICGMGAYIKNTVSFNLISSFLFTLTLRALAPLLSWGCRPFSSPFSLLLWPSSSSLLPASLGWVEGLSKTIWPEEPSLAQKDSQMAMRIHRLNEY